MNRRIFLMATGAALIAQPAFAQKLSLNSISRYLNGIQTAEAEFTQVNDDGTLSTGKLLLHRPGRMRFEYNPPEKLLVMAGGSQIAIFDGKSNVQRPEKYPLKQTPLNLILEQNVNLAARNMVVGHDYDGTSTTVVAQDPEHPEIGTLALKFTGDPVELRQWIVTDGQGGQTTVILGELNKGVRLPPHLFNIVHEESSRGRN
ncbi:MAG: LolA family protein [Boseongicola sp.]